MSSSSTSSNVDRSLFARTLKLVGLLVPSKECGIITGKFKPFLFQRPRMKRVYISPSENESDKRIILLSEEHKDTSIVSIKSQEFKTYLTEIGCKTVEYSLELTYDLLSTEEVLSQLLPTGTEIPSSFEQVGHIAHLNLRDSLLPYKNIIGQVILDKNQAIKTVVNKVGSIETEFRTFPMEVIAGEDRFEVVVRESNALFHFNFKDVYWNSRLQTEHSRLITMITNQKKLDSTSSSSTSGSPTAVSGTGVNSRIDVADMMAGVGPFAVPLAMRNLTVYANGTIILNYSRTYNRN